VGRRPVLVSVVCADGSSGLAPDLCSSGILPLRTLSDGAGGLLPAVPLESLDTGNVTFVAPACVVPKAYQSRARIQRQPQRRRSGWRTNGAQRQSRGGLASFRSVLMVSQEPIKQEPIKRPLVSFSGSGIRTNDSHP
jgi:hypothetical protein